MDAYLDALPAGVRSFPECQTDASLVFSLRARGALDGVVLRPDVEACIDAAGEGWLPEVVHLAVVLALRDARFGGVAGDDALIEWIDALSRPLARTATPNGFVTSPSAAARIVPTVWARYHKGTPVEVEHVGKNDARLFHRHPDLLFPPIAHEWRRKLILAMLAEAGAPTPTASLLARPGQGTEIRLTW